ncbi:FecR domain-containing protein [Pseudomonas sp. 148P]|uniref:FecR domain-containing protein n=1 Tax=Pseudomonas ulcerans TaxID=3115852 RepID=A0ABU7HUC1_9PSED|nr:MULTISPECIES: FecR domain-containing protein [unclassified Pseudomonas]MEE1923934.1 FecR domain-containing protein [Pseudomonas sp. 147P]MEE1935111.1 FecR domain-containing protein [Pseudomonas sp. 148P]
MLDREVLEAAATWYVNLSAAPADEGERKAWRLWLAQDVRHAEAWTQVEQLQQRMALLSPETALPALADVRARRRAVHKVLGLLLMAGAGGASLLAVEPLSSRMAQYRTAKGERRQLQLVDGSQLTLNTDSAVDVHYGSELREIRLHRGELLLQTASDPACRPLLVHTGQGSVRALGTRFSVYSHDDRSDVQVFEHAVELRAAARPDAVVRLEAGQQASFDALGIAPPRPLDDSSDAWTRGMLMAFDWPLRRVVAELARYRPGYLACSDAVAHLRVTGALRVDDTDTVLENLATALPIRVHSLTRYWVRIDAA